MTKKWYKVKADVVRVDDPLLAMVALLFEALDVKVEDRKLKNLSPIVQFLFEETSAPVKKELTTRPRAGIN